MQAYVIGSQKLQVYYRQHPDIPWTVDLDAATTFRSPEDAHARARVECGLEGRDYVVIAVALPDLADRRQYQQYLAGFPLVDPRD